MLDFCEAQTGISQLPVTLAENRFIAPDGSPCWFTHGATMT
jgi:hypothetical protein